MRLTIGIPSYNNYYEVWFTIQSLINYHNLNDCEILVIDNFGDDALRRYIKRIENSHPFNKLFDVKYVLCNSIVGSAYVRNKVFENASGDMVLCMDSHVLLMPGFLDNISYSDNLIHGPLISDSREDYFCEWNNVWRNNIWGIWAGPRSKPAESFDIWGMTCQLFLTSKAGWLGFNQEFRGWGGEVGYIHAKYRRAGRKVLCDPRLVWQHCFRRPDEMAPHNPQLVDRVRNYLIGFKELGLDIKPIEEHFDKDVLRQARNQKEILIPEVKI